MQEAQVGSLGQEDPLEKEMATQSSILAWKTPWTESLMGLQKNRTQFRDETTTPKINSHTSHFACKVAYQHTVY